MSSYWVNFIKTGNPNGENLPVWPVDADHMMRFNEKSNSDIILSKEKLELFLEAWHIQ
jgi:para-nitrobenzyl esterase